MKQTMIECIRNLEGMRRLASDWKRLASRSGSPLMQHDWFTCCASTLHSERDLRVFVVRDNERVTAIAPLVVVSRGLARWLEILGARYLQEPTGLLYEDPDALGVLMNAVIDQGVPVNLQRIRCSSPVWHDLHRLGGRRIVRIRRPNIGSCHLPIETGWDSFLKSLKRGRRANFNTARRRAESEGEVSTEIICPDHDDLQDILDRAFRVEMASWKGRGGSAVLQKPLLERFFREYASLSCRNGTLRVCFFSVAAIPIAMALGVVFAERFWTLKIGYDETWSRVSPGMQLTMETIRYAHREQLKGYEFLGSVEAWQHAWPSQIHEYGSVILYPYTIRGVVGFLDTGMSFVRGRLKKRR